LASDGAAPSGEDEEEGLLLGEEEEEEQRSGLTTTTIKVGGMTCGACTSAVEGAFKNVAGVKAFSISLLSERAVVEHDSDILSPEQVAEMIEDTGFDAEIVESKEAEPVVGATKSRRRSERRKLVTTTVAIEGMTCGACTSAVEGGFKDIEGLVQFNISLLAERAVIIHDPEKLSAAQIVEAIEDRDSMQQWCRA
jgi:Cu+-exporting ATPase